MNPKIRMAIRTSITILRILRLISMRSVLRASMDTHPCNIMASAKMLDAKIIEEPISLVPRCIAKPMPPNTSVIEATAMSTR
jgi:hypothetical protein